MNGSKAHTTYASAGMGGALVVVLAWGLKVAFNLDMPSEVAASLGVVLTGVLGYFFHKGDEK